MAVFRSSSKRGRSSLQANDSMRSSRRPSVRSTKSTIPEMPHNVSDRQLPLFELIEDFRRGHMPSNAQFLQWISTIEQSPAMQPSPTLSLQGQNLIQDIRALFGLLRRVIIEKNQDGLIQSFLHHSRLASRLAVDEMRRSGKIPIVNEPDRQIYLFGAKDQIMDEKYRTMRKSAMKDVRALYRLIQLVLTSIDFRDAIKSWQSIANRVMGESNYAMNSEKHRIEGEKAEQGESMTLNKTVRIKDDSVDIDRSRGKPYLFKQGFDDDPYGFDNPNSSYTLYSSRMSPTPTSFPGVRNIDATLNDLRNRVETTETDLERLRSDRNGTIDLSKTAFARQHTSDSTKAFESHFSSLPSTTNIYHYEESLGETTINSANVHVPSPVSPHNPPTHHTTTTTSKPLQVNEPTKLGTTRSQVFPEPTYEQTERLPITGIYQWNKSEQANRFGDGDDNYKSLAIGNPRQRENEEESIPRVPEIDKDTERFGTKEFPDDQNIKAILNDMRPLFQEFSSNTEFRKALTEGYSVIARLQATDFLEAKANVAPGLGYDANLSAAQKDLRHILERFASNQSLDPAISALGRIKREMQSDYALKDFVLDWQAFLTRCVQDPAYLTHEEYEKRGSFLITRTREYAISKYRRTFEEIYGGIKGFIEGWSNDELTSELGKTFRKVVQQDLLGQEVGTKEEQPSYWAKTKGASTGYGHKKREPISIFSILMGTSLKPDLIQDFRNYFLPQFLKGVYEVPIPRIESYSSSGASQLILEDLVIPSESFLPVEFDLKTTNRLRINPRQKLLGRTRGTKLERELEEKSGWQNRLRLKLGSIQTNIRNVKFHLVKAKGWPKIQDDGLADLKFGGKGLSIIVTLETRLAGKNRAKSFGNRKRMPRYGSGDSTQEVPIGIDPRYVRVKIERLRLRLHNTSRDWLYRLTSPILAARLKKQIERAIRDRIVGSVDFLDRAVKMLTKGILAESR